VYFAFRRWRRDVEHLTTCKCEACRRIPELDLKMVVHRGDFAIHEVAGSAELLGPNVILAHRLLKNSVTERTGTRAYALFTDPAAPPAAVEAEAVGSGAFDRLTEAVDDVGVVVAHVLDLARRWEAELDSTTVLVSAGSGADVEAEVGAPPAVVWDWMADPERRRRWNGADRIDSENPSGARGTGTQTHCMHGRRVFNEEIVDWKPHRYLTIRTTVPGGRAVFTIELAANESDLRDPPGTAIAIHIAPDSTGARGVFVRRFVLPKMRSTLQQGMTRLAELIKEEEGATPSVHSG
jgi:uncharacterized protein YndB with AHSA1/START domain